MVFPIKVGYDLYKLSNCLVILENFIIPMENAKKKEKAIEKCTLDLVIEALICS